METPALVAPLLAKNMKIKREFFHAAVPGPRSLFVMVVLIFLTGFRPVAADESAASVSAPQDSFNYALVGVARFDGVSYASLINRQTKMRLLLFTDKPVDGLKLISVGGDEATAGPSAIIDRAGVSIQLKVEADPGTDLSVPLSLAPSAFTNQVTRLPPPSSVSLAPRKPPPGTSLPLVFQAVDPQKLNLSVEEQQAINQLRRDFLSATNGASQGNPASETNNSTAGNAVAIPATSSSTESTSQASSPDAGSSLATNPPANGQGATTQQVNAWQSAQAQSDDLLRTLLGWQAFSAYQMALAN